MKATNSISGDMLTVILYRTAKYFINLVDKVRKGEVI